MLGCRVPIGLVSYKMVRADCLKFPESVHRGRASPVLSARSLADATPRPTGGPTGGVMMNLADQADLSELVLKAGPERFGSN